MSQPPPTDAEIQFRTWFNQEQPMMQIQDKTGRRIFDQALFREIRNQIESAYKAGWLACGQHYGPARDFDGNL